MKIAKILAVLTVLLLLLCGCGQDNARPTDTRPTYKPKQNFTVSFTQDGTVLGSQTLEEGTLVNQPSLDLQDNESFHYTFIGWDANGDGVPETFPYPLNANTEFVLLYESEPNLYHYDIYVHDELVYSADAKYGDYISYPEVKSSIDGDTVNIFLGWKYDGVFDGLQQNQVSKSVRIDAYFADSQILKMYYNNSLYAKYLEAGNELTFLAEWGIQAPSGTAIKWYTDSAYSNSFTSNLMPTGNLTLYGRAEATGPSQETGIPIASRQELLNYYNLMMINRVASSDFLLNYDESDANGLLNYLTANGVSLYTCQTKTTLSGKKLTLTMSFEPIAVKKTGNILYSQIKSFNVPAYPCTRGQSFNDFACERRANTFQVSNSDALFYALEHGFRPIVDQNNTALNNLYNSMKNVLRQIIRDDMNDLEKAKAIYEYLVMEVTYDGDLLARVQANESGLAAYNAFYLEGVFNDHLAVCDGISKAYAALCNMEGIPCVRISGTTTDGVAHAWNKIQLGGAWYVVDATSGGVIIGSEEVLTYAYFLISDAQYASRAREDGKYFPELKATAEFSIYEKIQYNLNNHTYSLKVTNTDDGAMLFRYFSQNAPAGKSTFDFMLAVPGMTAADALTEMMQKAEISSQIQFSQTQKSITVILSK